MSKSYKNIFIVTLSILLFFSFLFFLQTYTSPKVLAHDPDQFNHDSGSGSGSSSGSGSAVDNDTTFHMRDGISVALDPPLYYNGSGMRFIFYVPESYMQKYQAGKELYDSDWVDFYRQPIYSEYYFVVGRVPFSDIGAYYGGSVSMSLEERISSVQDGVSWSEFYNINPSDCSFMSRSLSRITRKENGMYTCEAFFPFPAESLYSTDFCYFVSFYTYTPERYYINDLGFLYNEFIYGNGHDFSLNYPWGSPQPAIHESVETHNYVRGTLSTFAVGLLDDYGSSMSVDVLRFYQNMAGININSGTFTVNLKYKRCIGFNQVQEVTEQYNVNSLFAGTSDLVYSELSGLKGFSSLSDFNCVFNNVKYRNDVAFYTDSRIILQADHYNYSFNSSQNIGTFEIVYVDFSYKDFAIEVRDNDDSDGIDLTFYVYPVVVSETSGRTSMLFRYNDIETFVLNSVGWLCDLDSGVFSVVGSNSYVSVEFFDDYLVVSFDSDKQSKLLGVRISCNCQVIEDFDCDVSLEYVRLDNNLDETVVTDNLTMKYSEYVVLAFSENVYNSYGLRIDSAIHPSVLNGVDYYSFSNVRCSKIGEARYKITVLYDYTTLFKLTNTLNNDIVYQPLTKNSLSYYGVDLDYTIPYGYRISDLSTTDSHSVTIANNEEYFNETRVVVNCSTQDKKIIPLVATFVDTWHVDFMYLDQYNDSCFAVKRIERKDLRIADYGNIRELSLSNVASILNRDSMDVLKSGADETLKVEFNGKSTYTVTLTYSYTTIRMSEASGQYGELKVPLSCYADWCNGIGQNWSILYLNNPENNYFRYSNEVPRENLYGYFASVVFTEQLRDINTWFAQESGDGAVVLSVGKEIRGSDFYKFIRNNTLTFAVAGAAIGGVVGGAAGGPIGAIGGVAGGAGLGVGLNLGIAMLCETFDDQNATYYTYFTYLDCKSEQAFLSRSGATDAYDRDNAVTNTAQKVESDLTDFFSGLKTDTDNFVKIAGIVLGAVGALLVLSLIIRILSPVISKTRDRKRDKKNE